VLLGKGDRRWTHNAKLPMWDSANHTIRNASHDMGVQVIANEHARTRYRDDEQRERKDRIV
jgi:hypothetical protein